MEIYREVLSRRAAERQQQFTSLAARALKTACVLGYWGLWREARALVQRFRVPGARLTDAGWTLLPNVSKDLTLFISPL